MNMGISVSINDGNRYRIEAKAYCMGNDLIVLVGGGTHPHAGAFTVHRAATTAEQNMSVCFPGHRDDIVAQKFLSVLSELWDGTVIVIAGIHVDQATQEDIRLLLSASDECLDQLTRKLDVLNRTENQI